MRFINKKTYRKLIQINEMMSSGAPIAPIASSAPPITTPSPLSLKKSIDVNNETNKKIKKIRKNNGGI